MVGQRRAAGRDISPARRRPIRCPHSSLTGAGVRPDWLRSVGVFSSSPQRTAMPIGDQKTTILGLASRPCGVNSQDVADALGILRKVASNRLCKGRCAGWLFSPSKGCGAKFFSAPVALDPVRPVRVPTRKPDPPNLIRHTAGSSKRAKAGPSGDPIITSETRITIAASTWCRAKWETQPGEPALFADRPRYGGYE